MIRQADQCRAALGIGLLLLALSSEAANTSSIRIKITDREDAPVPEVVAYASPISSGTSRPETDLLPATMVQRDSSFSPHILVVPAGTSIRFPNADPVLHHVYSFSPAKRFDMTVDSGAIAESLRFDEAGIVTLGCNIHDDMLAYIVVVDTAHFAHSDGEGIATITGLAPGRYEVSFWTPRLAAKHLPEPVIVDIASGETQVVGQRLENKLYPAHEHSETSLNWSY